jgi:hypothetical protein
MEDLFGDLPPPPRRMDVHVITVTRAEYEEPRGNFVVEWIDFDYEIDHGVCELRGDDCIVESTVRELNLHAALFGVWDSWDQGNRIEVGQYRVRGWVEKFDVPGEPIEWDAGIELIDEDEECDGG